MKEFIITRESVLELIKNEVSNKNITISELEQLAGISKDSVRDFMRGKTYLLRADKLQKIFDILRPDEKLF